MVEKETFAQSLGSHLFKLNIGGVIIIDSLPDQPGCEILAPALQISTLLSTTLTKKGL